MEGESFNYPPVIYENGKQYHYRNAQSIVEFHIINGKPIQIYDQETDSLKTYEPGHPAFGDNYYVVSSATYLMQGEFCVVETLFCEVECMLKEEFETRFAGRYGDPPRPRMPPVDHWPFDPYGLRGTHHSRGAGKMGDSATFSGTNVSDRRSKS